MKKIEQDDMIKVGHFNWDKAKHFYHVAKSGSISGAAKFLNMQPSALSRRMSDLESDLRCQLLIRQSRGIEITRKGEEFLEIVERTYHDLRNFNYNNTVMSHNGQKRKIRISTTHAVAAYMLGDILVEYNKINSQIVFEIITDDQLLDILINEVDIAIRPHEKEIKGIKQDYAFVLEKKLYASDSYINEYGEPKTATDLINHHVISHAHPNDYPYSNLEWILKIGMVSGEIKKPIFTTTSLENAVIAAEKGLGILGSYQQMKIIKNSNLKNILPEISDQPVKWYLIYPEILNKDQEIIKFKKFVLSKL